MLEPLVRRRVLGLLVGLALVVVVAVLGTIAGLPFPYPLVLGFAVYVPITAFSAGDDRFDLDAYLAERTRGRIALDAALVAAGAFALGALAGELAIGAGAGRAITVGVAVAGTFLGGQVAFFVRTRAYHRPWQSSAFVGE